MKFEMTAEVRDAAGKGVAHQLRRNGKIPGVLYGQGDCILLALQPTAVSKILFAHAGTTALITLKLEGATHSGTRTALLRDYQLDPVTGDILHADLFEISMNKPIRVRVPVTVVGDVPVGVKAGGVLQHSLREVHVECLPTIMPDHINVDASLLEIGQGIHVRELTVQTGVKILDDEDYMVVNVAAPISEEKLEALLTTGAEVSEPEVVGKAKEEGEEPEAEKGAPAAEAKGDKKEMKDAKEDPRKAREEPKKAKEESKK
ncbi:MAG: 50S ribosomal protein L25 [Nitrospirales bacterium]